MKNIISITVLVFSLNTICLSQKTTKNQQIIEINEIKLAFEKWVLKEIKEGKYLDKDSCFKCYGKREGTGMETFHFVFADINGDNKLDALATFNLYPCYGGNASLGQCQVLIISGENGYSVIDNFFNNLNKELGVHTIDSAASNQFFGTSYEYLKNDSPNFPSIQKRFSITYDTKNIEFIDKK